MKPLHMTPVAQLAPADIMAGLLSSPRKIPCKYFYDEVGAQLFEQICRLPEYYPTRTEIAILRAHLSSIAAWAGSRARIVELGSGSGQKTRLLLDQLREPIEYVPIDICAPQLITNALALRALFPGTHIQPLHADYTVPVRLRPSAAQRTIVFFPGSTIGNFEPLEAVEFLRRTATLAGAGGGLLIGVDLKKDVPTLERAYNDAAAITAAFNRNILSHVNELCDADFNLAGFEHYARYNQVAGRIEMWLRSCHRQRVLLGRSSARPAIIDLEAGELIHTEHSYKYSIAEVQQLVELAGFRLAHTWTDPQQLFSVHACDVVRHKQP